MRYPDGRSDALEITRVSNDKARATYSLLERLGYEFAACRKFRVVDQSHWPTKLRDLQSMSFSCARR